MHRDDRLYDACLVLDWNYTKRARNRGSAIFLHMTRTDKGPTAGCIGLDPALMARLLPRLLRGVCIAVLP
jgi:L,D-peptidoglycan transpeptidase YkuD (ErfK/YbiS/YcfS/YnhG family)